MKTFTLCNSLLFSFQVMTCSRSEVRTVCCIVAWILCHGCAGKQKCWRRRIRSWKASIPSPPPSTCSKWTFTMRKSTALVGYLHFPCVVWSEFWSINVINKEYGFKLEIFFLKKKKSNTLFFSCFVFFSWLFSDFLKFFIQFCNYYYFLFARKTPVLCTRVVFRCSRIFWPWVTSLLGMSGEAQERELPLLGELLLVSKADWRPMRLDTWSLSGPCSLVLLPMQPPVAVAVNSAVPVVALHPELIGERQE